MDRLLDASVYAPIGFVLTRGKTVDDLAVAGRKQIAFSRSLGRAVIKGLVRSTTKTHPDTAAEQAPVAVAVIDELGGGEAAVEGYADLTAREIVALVTQSDQPRVRWIRDQEAASKKRVTVLRAADRVLD